MKLFLSTYQLVVVMGLSILMSVNGTAQDSTYVDVLDLIEDHSVRWIDQVPSHRSDKKYKNKGWFKRLLLGNSSSKSIQKPVSVLALNNSEHVIFDQGNGTLFIATDKNIKIPRLFKKKDSYFPSLVASCLLPDKNILFTDSKLNKIFQLNSDHKILTEFNKDLVLEQPTGIAYAPQTQNIWVVETAAHRITILDAFGNKIKSFGQRGKGEGEFNYPTYICVGSEGNIYIVDALNYRVQIFSPDGEFISMFGENGNGSGYIASPKGIATDSYGNIYLVDALFHGVQIFDTNGNYLHQFGTQGRGIEEFWMPSGIFIDKTDHIYIADSYNSRVQIFELIYKE